MTRSVNATSATTALDVHPAATSDVEYCASTDTLPLLKQAAVDDAMYLLYIEMYWSVDEPPSS
jgi:hypothetical protein